MAFLNRRNFLGNAIALSSFPIIGKLGFNSNRKVETAQGGSKAFSITSGNLSSSKHAGICITELKKANQLLSDIGNLRNQHSYYSQIKYHSNDKYKLNICKDIIDLFVNENDFKLYVKVIVDPRSEYKSLSPLQKIDYKLNIYSELVDLGSFKKNIDLHMKAESPFGPSYDFVKKIELDDNIKLKIKTTKAREDDLLQAIGFLTGMILADMRGIVQNPIKVEILQYFKDQLGVSSFTKPTTINNKLYII